MRFLIQRTTEAEVRVDGEIIGAIKKGFVVFIGISNDDSFAIADKMINKLVGLRIFEDDQGKTNLALKDVDGELLLISQFTLYANCKKGNRPSFVDAGAPAFANDMYEYVVSKCKEQIDIVETGSFGADMKVSLLNDGPFTVILDSKDICG